MKVELKEQTKKGEAIPDEVKVQSVALNNPYTPNEDSPVKKEEKIENQP